MVRERRLILDITDIKGIDFRCERCKREIFHPLADDSKIQEKCPFCGEPWVGDRMMREKDGKEVLLEILRYFYREGRALPAVPRLVAKDEEESGEESG